MGSKVYVLQCEQYFKIGYTSKDVKSRIKGMTTGNPFPITPIFIIDWGENDRAARACETKLQDCFSGKWEQGEWYALNSDDLNKIRKKYKDRIAEINEPHPHALNSSYNKEFEYYKRRYWDYEQRYRKECNRNALNMDITKRNHAQEMHKMRLRVRELENQLQSSEENEHQTFCRNAKQTIDDIIGLLEFTKKTYK